MRYVSVPSELHSSEVRSEEFCLSPGRYVRFKPPKQKSASRFVPLDKLVVVRNESIKINKDATYQYAEIGDIDVATGGVTEDTDVTVAGRFSHSRGADQTQGGCDEDRRARHEMVPPRRTQITRTASERNSRTPTA